MKWRKKAARAGPLDDGLIGYLQETIELNDPPKQYLQGAFVPLLIGLMLILPWPEIGLSLPGSNTRTAARWCACGPRICVGRLPACIRATLIALKSGARGSAFAQSRRLLPQQRGLCCVSRWTSHCGRD